jgi:DNA-binding NarL/FixJ family response regulator
MANCFVTREKYMACALLTGDVLLPARNAAIDEPEGLHAAAVPLRGEVAAGSDNRFRAVYELVTRLAVAERNDASLSLRAVLNEVLQASIQLVGADAGYIRLFEVLDLAPLERAFPFVAQVGISDRYLSYFSDLSEPVDVKARMAVASGRRVIIEDMFTHPSFQPHLEVVVAEGYRSLQSTPLMSANGARGIGNVCTYFIDTYTPPAETFETLDLYAELAASAIEAHQQIAELARHGRELTTVLQERDDSLRRIHDQLSRIQQRAFSLEPEDVRRLAHSIDLETQRALADAEAGAPAEALTSSGDEYPYGLSERELEVLVQIWQGMSDKQIALALGISRFTVFKHVRMVLQKLGADTRTQAGVRAEHEGLYRYLPATSE